MQLKQVQSIRRSGLVLIVSTLLLLGSLMAITHAGQPAQAQAATDRETFDEIVAARPPQQSRECDGTETGRCLDGTCTHSESEVLACIFSGGVAEWFGIDGPPPIPEIPIPPVAIPGAQPTIEVLTEAPPPPAPSNLIVNGNFESGFYAVPELGFEPPDVGNVPKGWYWYKNQAYGKYTIFNNQTLGLECPYASDAPPAPVENDPVFGPIPGVSNESTTSALGLHIQSSDEQDARIGVYQVVDGLTPGQTYRFSMSGTLQIQSGATTLQPNDPKAPEEAQNHTIELYFDQTGNTDWKAIPHEKWTIIEWPEEKLEFKVSEDDEDLADIQSYQTFVTAQSNKMTVFVTLWRKWANWRTGIASIDCIALQPATPQMIQAAEKRRANFVDLSGGTANVQPAAAGRLDSELPVTGDESQLQPEAAPAQLNRADQPVIEPPTSPQQPADSPQAISAQPPAVPNHPPDQAQVSAAPVMPESPVVNSAEASVVEPAPKSLLEASNSILILLSAAVAAVVLVGAGLWRMR
ncbi:MAG: hypothetical protein H6631_16745 [Anaerolineaceae bacterium]|nr:hypothetical protein [Anaerolineaceae bacterium]MCB9099632.1 hypothetical protein [Anaerolineales bacterium]